MEQLTSRRNTSTIGQKPLMSFAIANNLLTPNTKAINLRISPWETIATTYNNSKNLEDGSFGMKHLNKCSYTIPDFPSKNKWGVVVKVWVNKALSITKVCSC